MSLKGLLAFKTDPYNVPASDMLCDFAPFRAIIPFHRGPNGPKTVLLFSLEGPKFPKVHAVNPIFTHSGIVLGLLRVSKAQKSPLAPITERPPKSLTQIFFLQYNHVGCPQRCNGLLSTIGNVSAHIGLPSSEKKTATIYHIEVFCLF